MSNLEALNYFVFQFLCFRIARIGERNSDDTFQQIGWGVLFWVAPFSGWGIKPYRPIGKRYRVKIFYRFKLK
jgi:hypothetical protein